MPKGVYDGNGEKRGNYKPRCPLCQETVIQMEVRKRSQPLSLKEMVSYKLKLVTQSAATAICGKRKCDERGDLIFSENEDGKRSCRHGFDQEKYETKSDAPGGNPKPQALAKKFWHQAMEEKKKEEEEQKDQQAIEAATLFGVFGTSAMTFEAMQGIGQSGKKEISTPVEKQAARAEEDAMGAALKEQASDQVYFDVLRDSHEGQMRALLTEHEVQRKKLESSVLHGSKVAAAEQLAAALHAKEVAAAVASSDDPDELQQIPEGFFIPASDVPQKQLAASKETEIPMAQRMAYSKY